VLSTAGAGSGYLPVAVALGVAGLGMGLSMPTALDAVLGSLPEEQTGAGTGLSRTVQQTGASFGVAVLGSILNAVYRSSLQQHIPAVPGDVRAASKSNVAAAMSAAQHLAAPAAPRLVEAAFNAYASGMTVVLIVCATLLAAAAVLTLLFLPARAGTSGSAERAPVSSAVPAR
jgi:hypothetical protein